MSILDKMKSFFSGDDGRKEEYDRIIQETLLQYAKPQRYFYSVEVYETDLFHLEVAKWPDQKKVDFIVFCVNEAYEYHKLGIQQSDSAEYRLNLVREGYVRHLLSTRITFEETDYQIILEGFSRNSDWGWYHLLYQSIPKLLNRIEIQYKDTPLPVGLNTSLDVFKASWNHHHSANEKEYYNIVRKLENIFFVSYRHKGEIRPCLFLGKDLFTPYANLPVESMSPEMKNYWHQLITFAHNSSASKPSTKFLSEARKLIECVGTEHFYKTIEDWFSFLINLKETTSEQIVNYGGQTIRVVSHQFLSSTNTEGIKGLVWMSILSDEENFLPLLSRLAERCFRKIPGKGPAAAAIGNACLYALSSSKGNEGISYLSRLKVRVKQNSAQRIIEKYLVEAATAKGVSMDEIQDMVVDAFGLVDGARTFPFKDYTCVLRITGIGKSELTWFKPDQSTQKSVPAFVKEEFATPLKELKSIQKQIDQSTSAQRERIDRMMRTGRSWSMANFKSWYVHHGLMSFLTKKIIWILETDGKRQSAMLVDSRWINFREEEIVPGANDLISLWHPVSQSVEEIMGWREYLIRQQLQQPVKQAFREVYILTDAEAITRNYSNRMAAHILKQHQYVSLARIRNWVPRLLGAWDGGDDDIAELTIPELHLKAQLWIRAVEADNAFNSNGIWNYVSTDQVRFVQLETNTVIDLVNVPATVFSEVMRDVDLFVGVASVGNDPAWRDNGGLRDDGGYWTRYSFGDLSEMAKNRKELLARLISRLKINKVAEIRDKFLVVKGKLRTYKIHIGSTNILMEPNDQYLCIVPDRAQKDQTGNLYIPFEGDAGLSIILSKAFLLAEDDKITDPNILSQIKRRE